MAMGIVHVLCEQRRHQNTLGLFRVDLDLDLTTLQYHALSLVVFSDGGMAFGRLRSLWKNMEKSPFQWGMFTSYVTLPEGTSFLISSYFLIGLSSVAEGQLSVFGGHVASSA